MLWIIVEADFFIILYDAINSKPEAVGHGRDGYYIGENGDFVWHDFAKAVGKALVRRGLSESDEPTTFTTEEIVEYFGSEVSSCRILCSVTKSSFPVGIW